MLKIMECFGGIGACSKALERLNIEHEVVDYVEIDKYAVKSFNAIHGTNFEPQDITQWDKDIEVDLIMHGSPCQDFSLAGKQSGGDENSGTRSSLMYETLRIVEKLKPKYVLWENVKNIISKNHKHNFDNYIERMNNLGYHSCYQVLNAKDYGIPQNRERVFTISIRNDIDKEFVFPEKQELKLRLKDMLEDDVDEKYYLSDNMNKSLISTLSRNNIEKNVSFINGYNKKIRKDNLSGTITTRINASNNTYLSIKNATKQGYKEAYDGDSVNLAYPESETRRGRVGNQVSQTLTTSDNMGVVENILKNYDDNTVCEIRYDEGIRTFKNNICGSLRTIDSCGNKAIINNLRIRKLTPKECWRLMGFDDADFEKASQVNSNAQLYKQAGNSIVVNVLEAILKNLLVLN